MLFAPANLPFVFILTKNFFLAKLKCMKTVSIHDAKTNLSKYIAAAKRGEQIAIGAYGKQEVWLVAKNPDPSSPKTTQKPRRQFGGLKGKIWVAPDAFSSETDKKIADLMINSKIFPDD